MSNTGGFTIDTTKSIDQNLATLGIQLSPQDVNTVIGDINTMVLRSGTSYGTAPMMGGMRGGMTEDECKKGAISRILWLVAAGASGTVLGASYVFMASRLCPVGGVEGLAYYTADKFFGMCSSAQTALTTTMAQASVVATTLGVTIKASGEIFVPNFVVRMVMKTMKGCNPPDGIPETTSTTNFTIGQKLKKGHGGKRASKQTRKSKSGKGTGTGKGKGRKATRRH